LLRHQLVTSKSPSSNKLRLLWAGYWILDIGYKGPITMEFLPPVSNPYLVAQSEHSEVTSIYDQYTKQAIDHMKKISKSLSG
jgi:hypothetical protein